MKLQYNEKPSALNNIGQDISGAHRHNFNTYTDEQKIEREKKKSDKKAKDTRKADFKEAIARATCKDEVILLITQYEHINTCDLLGMSQFSTVDQLRTFVSSNRTRANCMAFNKFIRLVRRLPYKRDAELFGYLDSKKIEKYQHITGVEKQWKTDLPLSPTAISFFSDTVKAVQFGNSLSENERIFNLNNLEQGLVELRALVNIDFTRVGFSFGARGKAGSVAHYEDSNKVIAINRSRCGSIVHEIGHALDYQRGLISYNLPHSLVQRYREKVYGNPMLKINAKYLLNKKEIFARAFEAYISSFISNSYLLDGDRSDWPELDASDIEWMKTVVQS